MSTSALRSATFEACTGVSVTRNVCVLPLARDALRVGVDHPEAHPPAGADLDRRHQLELELHRTQREPQLRHARLSHGLHQLGAQRPDRLTDGTRPSSAMWRS